MKYIFTALCIVLLISACETQTNQVNSGFVTLLGNDTLAVEQFEFTDTGINAKVILRSPETSFSSYDLRLDANGGIHQMTRTNYSIENGFNGDGNVVQRIERMGDSLSIEIQTGDGSETYNTRYEPGILPFIDMVH